MKTFVITNNIILMSLFVIIIRPVTSLVISSVKFVNRIHAIKDSRIQSHLINSKNTRFSMKLMAFEDLGVSVYDAQLYVSQFVENQLKTASPTSLAFLYGSGLLSAFSPCSISLLPLTLAYLGGSTSSDSEVSSTQLTKSTTSDPISFRTISYAAGLASMLTTFGLY